MRTVSHALASGCMRSALEILPRWKPRGSWWDYGESALTVGATAVSARCIALFTALAMRGSRGFGFEVASSFGRLVLRTLGKARSAQVAWAGLALCSQRGLSIFDGRWVMRPVPGVVRATLVSGHVGRVR